MNPCPVDVKRRIHVLAIDEVDGSASLDIALRVAPQFGLANDDARDLVTQVGAAVSKWREVAKIYKLKPAEIDRMSSAFEHEDLRKATGVTARRPTAKAAKKKTDKKQPKIAAGAER
jgi:serine/threonine-protein kinase HipA